jgi:hypothetical protein
MKDYQSQSHVKWGCKYHVVWCPKYRRKKLYGKLPRVPCVLDHLEISFIFLITFIVCFLIHLHNGTPVRSFSHFLLDDFRDKIIAETHLPAPPPEPCRVRSDKKRCLLWLWYRHLPDWYDSGQYPAPFDSRSVLPGTEYWRSSLLSLRQ